MRQSIYLLSGQPGWLRIIGPAVIALAVLAAPAVGQHSYRVRQAENFRKDPSASAVLLAALRQGTLLDGSTVQNGWAQVTLEGWIWAQSVTVTNREGHNRVVSARGGENLRAEPNGKVLARLSNGCLLDEVDTRSGWMRVRRSGWVWARSLEQVDQENVAAGVTSSGGAIATSQPGLDRAVTADETQLHRSPDGPATGTLGPEAPVRVMARSGEWVRIQTEGWVRESDLKPATAGVLAGVSAAEVRSRPSEFEGRLVQWTVQYLSLQEADELRKDIPQGRKYVLGRGPLPEAGFVYVMLSDEQVAEVARLQPLAQIVIVGRIRVGRSRYLGNPIVELVEMAIREP